VPLYNRTDPELNGWPFFYWFQMALIPFATLLTIIAFALSRIAGRKDVRPAAGPVARSGRKTRGERRRGQRLRLPVPRRHRPRLRGCPLAPRRADGQPRRVGLGGRGFGTFIAWFLIGGDRYTAYTFIAVPATLYAGSVVGFFAVPYTIVVYPLIFLFLPKLWSVSHRLACGSCRSCRRS
jgi:hypothetical protein